MDEAIHYLNKGGIIACPTESVYGLSCDPDNVAALKRLLAIKKRDPRKGLIVVGASFSQVETYLKPLDKAMQERIHATWPGPCTWVIPAKASVSPYLRGEFDTLAVRISNHEIVQALCTGFKKAIVSTSANVAGEDPAKTSAEVKSIFAGQVNCIIDGKVGPLMQPTPIFDACTGKRLR